MLASIGDAVGAAAPAACLPKNVPELERSGLHFPTRSPSRYRNAKGHGARAAVSGLGISPFSNSDSHLLNACNRLPLQLAIAKGHLPWAAFRHPPSRTATRPAYPPARMWRLARCAQRAPRPASSAGRRAPPVGKGPPAGGDHQRGANVVGVRRLRGQLQSSLSIAASHSQHTKLSAHSSSTTYSSEPALLSRTRTDRGYGVVEQNAHDHQPVASPSPPRRRRHRRGSICCRSASPAESARCSASPGAPGRSRTHSVRRA